MGTLPLLRCWRQSAAVKTGDAGVFSCDRPADE